MKNQQLPWEFECPKQMTDLLAGANAETVIEARLQAIENDRWIKAVHLLKRLKIAKEMVGLEIGSGCGFMSKPIGSFIQRLHCVDISQSFIDFSRKYTEEEKNVIFHKINDCSLGIFQEEEFDLVYSFSVFIHLNVYEIHWYFEEVYRVLKKGGFFYFDFMDSDQVGLREEIKFQEMSLLFRQNPNSYRTLLNYHSIRFIQQIAESVGFKLYCDIERAFVTKVYLIKPA